MMDNDDRSTSECFAQTPPPRKLGRKRQKRAQRKLIEEIEKLEGREKAHRCVQAAAHSHGEPNARRWRKLADKVLHPERYVKRKTLSQMLGAPVQ